MIGAEEFGLAFDEPLADPLKEWIQRIEEPRAGKAG